MLIRKIKWCHVREFDSRSTTWSSASGRDKMYRQPSWYRYFRYVSCKPGSTCRLDVMCLLFTLSEHLHDHFRNVLGIPVCQNRPHRGSGRRSRFLQLHGVPGLQRAPEPPASHQGWIHPLNFLIRVGLYKLMPIFAMFFLCVGLKWKWRKQLQKEQRFWIVMSTSKNWLLINYVLYHMRRVFSYLRANFKSTHFYLR